MASSPETTLHEATAILKAVGWTVLPPHQPPEIADGQDWLSGNGDSRRSILGIKDGDVWYGWHTDGEEYTCSIEKFREWITSTRAELQETPDAD